MVRSMYGVQRFEAAADTDIVARWRDRVSEGPVSPTSDAQRMAGCSAETRPRLRKSSTSAS